jgi:hypothetical protein
MAEKWVWQSEHYSEKQAEVWCSTINNIREARGYEPMKYKLEIEGGNFVVYAQIEMI